MKSKLFLIFLVSLGIVGCDSEEGKDQSTFIGGEIVNPQSEFFILSKGHTPIDTLYLNQNNRFGKSLEGLEEGIYRFNHPPENQILYLEPGDSILIWLNTLAFDESINFSGPGAKKSDFLLDLYLANQEESEMILSYYKYHPDEFSNKIDSIYQAKTRQLDKLIEEKDFSEDFIEIAKAGIDYQYYHFKERYAFLTRKYFKDLAEEIPEDFHSYRDDINFESENLNTYYVYTNFIDDYFRSKAIERCDPQLPPSADCFDLNSITNIGYKIILADSLIESPEIKNSYYDRLGSQGVTFSREAETIDSIINLLEKTDYDRENLDKLKQMAMVQKSLLPGNNIGDLSLSNVAGDTIKLREISDGPMITYHWSLSSKNHFRWQQNTIETLRKKYPEIDFVGINIDNNTYDAWAEIVKTQTANPDREFHLTFTRIDRELLKAYLNKTFFLNNQGEIIRGSSQINSNTFEREILEFLNRYN
ncbi:TlpA family protein disulfide reductase [Salegentibacter sp. F14]